MPLTPGTRLGPYEVTALIGVGGMGEVYRTTDTTLGRQVAIKVPPEALASDAERIARFEREAKTLAALNHPNIAQIYGFEKSSGVPALVMELVEGPTLADIIVGSGLSALGPGLRTSPGGCGRGHGAARGGEIDAQARGARRCGGLDCRPHRRRRSGVVDHATDPAQRGPHHDHHVRVGCVDAPGRRPRRRHHARRLTRRLSRLQPVAGACAQPARAHRVEWSGRTARRLHLARRPMGRVFRWKPDAQEGRHHGRAARARNPNSFSLDIFYFLLFDPAAGTGSDPRPAQPLHFVSPGLGRILARTGWDDNASWFTYKLCWASIDHQVADGNQFEFYRRGEWLLKERTGYDLDSGASINHNTLSLQNDPGPWEQTDYRYALSLTGSQWVYAPARDPRLVAHSIGSGFVYALGDATNLYNYADDLTDITHASRSIVWLQPDDIVVYDRAASKTAGRFKRFWLNLPEQPTISGTQARMASGSGGQQLIVTTLLPTDAVLTSGRAETLTGDAAENESMHYRLGVEAPGGPQTARFLHVLQGADTGAAVGATTLIQSSAGTPFVGAVVRSTAVMFPVDINATFSGVTYSVPAGTTEHLVTGLTPGATYGASVVASGSGVTVTIAAGGGTRRADSGGVLVISASTAATRPSTFGALSGVRAVPRTGTASSAVRASGRPSGLVAAASGSGVVLTWSAPPDVASIRYAIGGGHTLHESTLPVIVTPNASTQYTIPALP